MKNKFAPNYVKLNDATYERLNKDTVEIELDLEHDVLEQLDNFMKSEGFVSRGEALRYILRETIKNNLLDQSLEEETE